MDAASLLARPLQRILKDHHLPGMQSEGNSLLWLNFVEKAVEFEKQMAPLMGLKALPEGPLARYQWRHSSCFAAICSVKVCPVRHGPKDPATPILPSMRRTKTWESYQTSSRSVLMLCAVQLGKHTSRFSTDTNSWLLDFLTYPFLRGLSFTHCLPASGLL